MNLIEHLDFYQHVQPNKLFLFDERHFYSSKETYDIVSSLAHQFHDFGIGDNDKVLLYAERSVCGVFLFLALEMVGARTFVLNPEKKNLPFSLDITIRYKIDGDDGIFFLSDIIQKKRILLSFRRDNPVFNAFREDSDFDFVLFDSMDEKKAICVSENSLLESTEESEKRLGLKKNDVHMLITPLYQVEGISQVIYAIALQQALFIPKKADPDDILLDIQQYHVSVMFGKIDFYHQLMMMQLTKKKDLSSLNVGLVDSHGANEEELNRIEKVLPIVMVPVYGRSECLPITMQVRTRHGKKRLQGVGKPFEKMDIRFSADGEICVRSPFVSPKYLDGSPIMNEDGYFHTGDYGFFDKKGSLHIVKKK